MMSSPVSARYPATTPPGIGFHIPLGSFSDEGPEKGQAGGGAGATSTSARGRSAGVVFSRSGLLSSALGDAKVSGARGDSAGTQATAGNKARTQKPKIRALVRIGRTTAEADVVSSMVLRHDHRLEEAFRDTT